MKDYHRDRGGGPNLGRPRLRHWQDGRHGLLVVATSKRPDVQLGCVVHEEAIGPVGALHSHVSSNANDQAALIGTALVQLCPCQVDTVVAGHWHGNGVVEGPRLTVAQRPVLVGEGDGAAPRQGGRRKVGVSNVVHAVGRSGGGDGLPPTVDGRDDAPDRTGWGLRRNRPDQQDGGEHHGHGRGGALGNHCERVAGRRRQRRRRRRRKHLQAMTGEYDARGATRGGRAGGWARGKRSGTRCPSQNSRRPVATPSTPRLRGVVYGSSRDTPRGCRQG